MQIKAIPTIQRKSMNLIQPSQKMGNPVFGSTDVLRIEGVLLGSKPLKGQAGAIIIGQLLDKVAALRAHWTSLEADLMEAQSRCEDKACKKLMANLLDAITPKSSSAN